MPAPPESSDRMAESLIPPVSLRDYDRDFDGFARAIGTSYERYGFAVVSDHGLPAATIDGCLTRFREFFAWPAERKLAYHRTGMGGARGYTPFGVETAKGATHVDLKEFWHVGRELPAGHPYRRYMPDNLWVAEIDGFRDYTWGAYEAFDALGRRLLRAIARFLALPVDYFDDKVALGNSVLRVLHYPPVDAPTDSVRAGAHEDINVITLLLGAEEAGLQIKDRDGRWLPISPPPGCIVVNIGDMLQRLTNHRLPSTTHRVVNPAPERAKFPRYSMPYFLHFEPEFLIDTLPGCVSADRPNRYPTPITADGYLQQRLREIRLL
jgi:isopenicillin N synthase-like dioxygenase